MCDDKKKKGDKVLIFFSSLFRFTACERVSNGFKINKNEQNLNFGNAGNEENPHTTALAKVH